MITVLLADDHSRVLESLRSLLESVEDIQIVATAADGVEAVIQAFLSCPDVVILDISMPHMDGVHAIKKIRARCPHTHVMMLSMFDAPEYIQRSIDEGALGYVLKEEISKDLLAAVRAVHKGNPFFSEKIAPMAKQYMDLKGIEAGPTRQDSAGEGLN